MEEGLRGVWRIDLGCFVVLGDYEKSPLKDLRGVWRKVLGSLRQGEGLMARSCMADDLTCPRPMVGWLI